MLTAARRCHAAVLIGDDLTGATDRLPAALPVLHAELVQDPGVAGIVGREVLAFAGIAHPGKFFEPLRDAGAILVDARPFPDHHAYTTGELDRLLKDARACNAIPVTTPKDGVRLPPNIRRLVTVIGVGLKWRDEGEIDQFLEKTVAAGPSVVP